MDVANYVQKHVLTRHGSIWTADWQNDVSVLTWDFERPSQILAGYTTDTIGQCMESEPLSFYQGFDVVVVSMWNLSI